MSQRTDTNGPHAGSSTVGVRFNLLAMLSFITLSALLLGGLRLMNMPPHGVSIIATILLTVAAARLLYQRFHHPHFLSIAVGLGVTLVGEAALRIAQGLPLKIELGLIALGIAYGVVADMVVSGSTLIHHVLSSFARRND